MAASELLMDQLDYLKMPLYDIARHIASPSSSKASSIVSQLERANEGGRLPSVYVRTLVRDLYGRKLRLAEEPRMKWQQLDSRVWKATSKVHGFSITIEKHYSTWQIHVINATLFSPPVSHGYRSLDAAKENARLYTELGCEEFLRAERRRLEQLQ